MQTKCKLQCSLAILINLWRSIWWLLQMQKCIVFEDQCIIKCEKKGYKTKFWSIIISPKKTQVPNCKNILHKHIANILEWKHIKPSKNCNNKEQYFNIIYIFCNIWISHFGLFLFGNLHMYFKIKVVDRTFQWIS